MSEQKRTCRFCGKELNDTKQNVTIYMNRIDLGHFCCMDCFIQYQNKCAAQHAGRKHERKESR